MGFFGVFLCAKFGFHLVHQFCRFNYGNRLQTSPNVEKKLIRLVWFMVFNATFNNISVILWWSVLLVKETDVSGENHRETRSNNVVSSTPRHERG